MYNRHAHRLVWAQRGVYRSINDDHDDCSELFYLFRYKIIMKFNIWFVVVSPHKMCNQRQVLDNWGTIQEFYKLKKNGSTRSLYLEFSDRRDRKKWAIKKTASEHWKSNKNDSNNSLIEMAWNRNGRNVLDKNVYWLWKSFIFSEFPLIWTNRTWWRNLGVMKPSNILLTLQCYRESWAFHH